MGQDADTVADCLGGKGKHSSAMHRIIKEHKVHVSHKPSLDDVA